MKETVDAVRFAETEADNMIRTAEENAQDRKKQIKIQAQDYRKNLFSGAEKNAGQEMERTVNECRAYEKEAERKTGMKTADLKNIAENQMDAAVEAVINALV